MSLPARGAWIEIEGGDGMTIAEIRRSPHGERGLKSCAPSCSRRLRHSRSPHGERGLK